MDKEKVDEIEAMVEEIFEEDDYEEKVKVQRQANIELINKFGDFLEETGLKGDTIDKHTRNVHFYVNTFLQYYDVEPIEAGCYYLDAFLGDWFQRKAMWSTPNSTKENITSIKKFYSFLFDTGEISKEDFEHLKDDIKENKKGWIDGTRYNELNELSNPFGDDFDDDNDEEDFFNSELLTKAELVVKISNYVAAAATLYGVINCEDFLNFYHYYEEERITKVDLFTSIRIIQDIIDEEDIDYELHDDLIIHVSISPNMAPKEIEEDGLIHKVLLEVQEETEEWYLPPAEEVLEYSTSLHINPNDGINQLGEFLVRNRLFQPVKVDEKFTTLDFLLSHFHLAIKFGLPSEAYSEVLHDMLPEFKNLKPILMEELDDIFVDIFNELRMWSNKGFNLNEIDPAPLNDEKNDLAIYRSQNTRTQPCKVEKVGRNEPCPCGSGKKYKKCCDSKSHLTLVK